MTSEEFPQRHLVPESLEEWLSEWVVEHKAYEDKPIIGLAKLNYKYMLEGAYRN